SAAALRDKQRAARDLVELRYEDRRDEELRNRAMELAYNVQSNFNRTKFRDHWISSELSALSAALSPRGQFPLLTSAAIAVPGRVSLDFNAWTATELNLHEEEVYRDLDVTPHEYLQITGDWGVGWTSHNLSGRPLPMAGVPFARDGESNVARFDSLELPDGTTVRRVIVRAPVTRFARSGTFWLRPPRVDEAHPSRAGVGVAGAARSPGPRPGSGPFIGPPPSTLIDPRVDILNYPLPVFYLQCAWDVSTDNPRLHALIGLRDEQLAEI